MANIFGRQVVLPMTNKSGGALAAGDVVIVDTSNDTAVTTTTSAAYTGGVGVVQETIANNATGRVLFEGYAALVNVSASVTRGQYGATHTVAKQAAGTASRGTGTFAQWLTGGTTPSARIFPVDLLGSSLTNPMDGTGQLIYGGTAGAPTKLAAGTATTVLHGGASAPSYSGIAVVDLLSAVIDALMPWHVRIIPFIDTPDATTGTWTRLQFGEAATIYTFVYTGTDAAQIGLYNSSTAQNDAVSWDVNLAAGTWDAHFYVRKSTNTGIITLNQDGASQGTVDTYAASAAHAKVSITGFTVSTTGKHTMQIKAATKNGSSSGYLLELFHIEFRRTA